jgi:hypothetical protein
MLRLSACAVALFALGGTARASEPAHSPALDDMIVAQAHRHGVPEKLVRRIVMRESRYNPAAHHRSFWGLMQISYPTAKSMGFKGSPQELLDPVVNLTYAVPYLANAFIIAGKQEDAAVRLYASGYYRTAKNRRLLSELRTAESEPVEPGHNFLVATATPVANLITAVANVPNARKIAEAAPPVAAPPEANDASGLEPEVAMTPGKNGLAPPKKWTKDGGTTVIARGEQPVERIAAYRLADADAVKKHAARARTRKTMEFASLDAPAGGPHDGAQPQGQSRPSAIARQEPVYNQQDASAQAYAAPGADRGGAAAPEAAIAAATTGASAQPASYNPGQMALRGDTDEPRSAEHAKKSRAARALAKKDDATTKLADAGDGEQTLAKPRHATAKKFHQTVALAAKSDGAAPAAK